MVSLNPGCVCVLRVFCVLCVSGFWRLLDLTPHLPGKKSRFWHRFSFIFFCVFFFFFFFLQPTPAEPKQYCPCVMASPAEGWRRLRRNTAYVHLLGFEPAFQPNEGRRCLVGKPAQGPKVGFWGSGCLGVWVFGCLGVWVFWCLGVLGFRCFRVQVF